MQYLMLLMQFILFQEIALQGKDCYQIIQPMVYLIQVQKAFLPQQSEVIQMSKDLSGLTGLSEMGKTIGQQSGNAKSHLDSVANLYTETNKIHDVFSKDLANLIAEVAALKQKVKKNPHELKKFLVEKMRPLQDELMIGEQMQKQENKAAQQLMTEIKRENKQTSEAIVKTFQKLKHMEIKIGQYH